MYDYARRAGVALPDFEDAGNLPSGIHAATREEIAARFGYTPTRLA